MIQLALRCNLLQPQNKGHHSQIFFHHTTMRSLNFAENLPNFVRKIPTDSLHSKPPRFIGFNGRFIGFPLDSSEKTHGLDGWPPGVVSSMRWMASSVSKRSASTASREAMARRSHEFSSVFFCFKKMCFFSGKFAWKMDGIPMKTQKEALKLKCCVLTPFWRNPAPVGFGYVWVYQALKTSTAGFWRNQ